MPAITLNDIARLAAEATKRIHDDLPEQELPEKPKRKKKPIEITQSPTSEPEKPRQVMVARKITTNVAPSDPEDPINMSFLNVVKETGLDLTQKQTDALMNSFGTFKSVMNYAGIIRRCPGGSGDRKCEHFAICPFRDVDEGIYPVGQLCPIEKLIADREMVEYVTMTGMKAENLPLAIVNQIYNLIECDLTEVRTRNLIQDIGYKTLKPQFAINKTGEVVMGEEVSIEFEIQERVQRRKDNILKSLMFTPEIRSKHKITENRDKEMSPAEAVAFVKGKLLEQKNKTTEG